MKKLCIIDRLINLILIHTLIHVCETFLLEIRNNWLKKLSVIDRLISLILIHTRIYVCDTCDTYKIYIKV